MMPTPFILVVGFLGSGKTSFLKHVLERWAGRRRLAVVQNEFAASGVDGAELRRTGKPFHLEEINKGSVFCVCRLPDFQRTLRSVLDGYGPDAVLLEATGLADPIAVVQILGADGLDGRVYLAHAVCLVDVSTYLEWEPHFQPLSRQVRIADTVVLNKTDLRPSAVPSVRRRVRQINPFARTTCATRGKIPLKGIRESIGFRPVALRRLSENRRFESGGRPCIGTAVIKTANPISPENLRAFIKTAADEAYRIKGTVRLSGGKNAAVQSCFGRTTIRPLPPAPLPTELVVLGPDVQQREWTRRFLRGTSPQQESA